MADLQITVYGGAPGEIDGNRILLQALQERRAMPIYDRPVRLLMREMIKDLGLKGADLFDKDQALTGSVRTIH